MKRILLVNANPFVIPYPAPPIGIACIASSIPDRYEVKVYDATVDNGKNLTSVLGDFDPDYIGVGIRNVDDMSMEHGNWFVKWIENTIAMPIKREKHPDAGRKLPRRVILGGAGFSIFPDQFMKIFDADYGIIGEGEEIFVKLIEAMENGLDARNIPGIVKMIGSGFIVCNSEEEILQGKNFRPSRIYEWVDYSFYRERGSYPVQTKRGCPYNCIYCTYPLIEGRNYRLRSTESVAGEIEEVFHRLGNIMFEIVDSTFNGVAEHAEDICRALATKKLGITIRTMGMNPANVTEKLLELMMEAGFTQIDCTPDSASEKMLQYLGKNFSVSTLKNAARVIRKKKMPAMWFFLFGGPGENEKTLEETFSFIRNEIDENDMVHMTAGIRIYPKTELARIAIKEGIINNENSLFEPKFYISSQIGRERLLEYLLKIEDEMPNCIMSVNSTPSREMMKEAVKIRKEMGLKEPMFRTLLRLRKMGWR